MFRPPHSACRPVARLVVAAVRSYGTGVFHPFTQSDEDDLVRVIQTTPRHVLKHVRKQVWKARKRDLFFRQTVTHLVLLVQEFLRSSLLKPTDASEIIEGVLGECVSLAQHDMAHLLFRALLRFRSHGCTISVDAIRLLFESYKENDSRELMRQLADEMGEEASLRPLRIAAYLFAGCEDAATALLRPVSNKVGDGQIDDKVWQAMTIDDYLALIVGYDKRGKFDQLLAIHQACARHHPGDDAAPVYQALLRLFHQHDDTERFRLVFTKLVEDKVTLTPAMFTTVLRHKMRHVSSAKEIAEVEAALGRLGYVADVTGSAVIVTAYARLSRGCDAVTEEAMLSKVDMLLAAIEARGRLGEADTDVTAAHIQAVFRGYGAAGRVDRLKMAWQQVRGLAVASDTRVYNELMKWYALLGNVRELLALKVEMETAGLYPDARTYTWLLRALGRYFPHHAERLYDEMKRYRVRPDIALYNTLLGTLGDLHGMDRVQVILQEMYQREQAGTLRLTPLTFAILIRLAGNDLDRATAHYEEAKKRDMSGHTHVQTSMLNVLARNCADAAGEARLHAFLDAIPVWDVEVYNVMLNAYAKRDDRANLTKLVEKMNADHVAMNEVTYGTLLTAFARWNDEKGVTAILQDIKAKGQGGGMSAEFYAVLATSMSHMGNPTGVNDAWDDLIASRLLPTTKVYNQFIALYSQQHDTARMRDVLRSMTEQVPPNPVTATTILDVLGKSGQLPEMEELFEDMRTTPDTRPTSVTYHQMMNTYAKMGDVMRMNTVYQQYQAEGYVDNAATYNIRLEGYGRARDFDAMEALLQRRHAEQIADDDLTYCILITAYGRAAMKEEVERLFEEVTQSAEEALLTHRVIWSFMDAFCRCNTRAGVEQCVELVKMRNKDNRLTRADYLHIIPYFCRLGLMDLVDAYVKEMEINHYDLSYTVLNSLARGYARAGRLDKTVETLHAMRDRNWVPDAATALRLSSAFIKVGLHEQGRQVIEWRRRYAKRLLNERSHAEV